MTLDYILKAAVSSMIRGKHAPYCYSAHVPGKGYVNDGGPEYDRADYLRQLEQTATSEIENIGWAAEYAEPGYQQPRKGVLWANWNNLPRDLGDLLEKAGWACEWSDEWTTCDACQKAIRTEPDSFCWEPSYAVGEHDGEVLCKACWLEEYPQEIESE